MVKDKFLRLLVPSVPVLARTPIAPLLDIVDYYLRKSNSKWSNLPPASLRMRIGVGNKILRNHNSFIELGKSTIAELSSKNYMTPSSQVLELGCGCGRNAIALSQFLDQSGRYVGQDVDPEMISWCQKKLGNDRFSFHHANLFSKVYNPKGGDIVEYSFPVMDQSITIIFSVSVFSHLLYKDAVHYVRESKRTLVPGGYLHMTLFILDFLKDRLGDRWTFAHQLDNCYIESLRYPEAAVAYDLSTITEILTSNGFSIAEIYHKDLHQQTVVARKV